MYEMKKKKKTVGWSISWDFYETLSDESFFGDSKISLKNDEFQTILVICSSVKHNLEISNLLISETNWPFRIWSASITDYATIVVQLVQLKKDKSITRCALALLERVSLIPRFICYALFITLKKFKIYLETKEVHAHTWRICINLKLWVIILS